MKKSLLALALFGASVGVAHAQSSVVIYGNVDIGMIKRTNQALNIGKRANNTLGFRGAEDLGNGLKAIFQLEMRYEPDSGTIEQGAGGIQRPTFQGQTRVGLDSATLGMLRIGRGLTAFQETSIGFEPFRGIPSPSGFQADLMVAGYTSDPLGLPGNSANRFSNAVFYNSPVMRGFQLNTTIGTRDANQGLVMIGRGTAAAPQYAANAMASANPFSVTGTYKNAIVGVMLALERNAVETELRSIAAYVMPTPELKLMGSIIQQDQSHTRLINADTNAWVLGANYTVGPGRILAGVGQRDTDGLAKVKQVSLGYEYSLSKRTYLYADLSNKKGVPAIAPATGTSITHYALGVNHSF